jgi:hypothetical protein
MTQCPTCYSYFKHVRRLQEVPIDEQMVEMGCPAMWDPCWDTWHNDPRPARIKEIERALEVGAGSFTGQLTNELERLRREWSNA